MFLTAKHATRKHLKGAKNPRLAGDTMRPKAEECSKNTSELSGDSPLIRCFCKYQHNWLLN